MADGVVADVTGDTVADTVIGIENVTDGMS
jgi:hypothetical protein